jgi:hypothetical protein
MEVMGGNSQSLEQSEASKKLYWHVPIRSYRSLFDFPRKKMKEWVQADIINRFQDVGVAKFVFGLLPMNSQ